MIYSKHRFTLEMQAAHSQIAIPVTVGDTGKIFYINLTDGGEPYKITDGSLAVLTIHRPTGTYLQAFCPIKNNSTIVYDFLQNENTATVEGIHNCELTLYGPTSEGVISTSWFTMVVTPRVIGSDDLILTDEIRTAIDAMLAEEATRQSNEEARVAAEKEREAYYEDFVERVNNGEFDGEDGDNGGYYVPYYNEATGELLFSPTRSDMEFVGSVGVVRGERGATGEKGEKGEKGDKGDPGELPAVSKTVTLTASQWAEHSGDGIMYELPFEGMTATTTVICSVAPDLAMEQEVLRCMVRCVIQEDGYLWFKALSGEAPTIDIDMNILAMG